MLPTAAVLSIDDVDVIRPCMVLDYTFYTCLRNPDRQVGFDAVRSHDVEEKHLQIEMITTLIFVCIQMNLLQLTTTTAAQVEQWKLLYMSVTERTNLYSLTLTRYTVHSFINIT